MMDAKEFLKKYLDSKTGHIKNKDLQEIIPQLQKIISEQTAGREPRRDEMQTILRQALAELGWDASSINKLSKPHKRSQLRKNSAPGFKNTKSDGTGRAKCTEFVQGGAPGLGKKK